MDRRILGKRIREERTRIGLTQEQIAEYMDVSTTYIGLVERGERAVTLEKLVLLAECFHVTVDSLLREAERQESLDKKEQLLFLWSRAVPEDQDKSLAIMDIIIHGASQPNKPDGPQPAGANGHMPEKGIPEKPHISFPQRHRTFGSAVYMQDGIRKRCRKSLHLFACLSCPPRSLTQTYPKYSPTSLPAASRNSLSFPPRLRSAAVHVPPAA